MSDTSKAIVQEDQSIFDLALQEYGAIQGIPLLLSLNKEVNLGAQMAIGSLMNIKISPLASEIPNLSQLNYYRDRQISVVNGREYVITNEVDSPEDCSGFSDGFSDGFGCPEIQEAFSDGFSDGFSN